LPLFSNTLKNLDVTTNCNIIASKSLNDVSVKQKECCSIEQVELGDLTKYLSDTDLYSIRQLEEVPEKVFVIKKGGRLLGYFFREIQDNCHYVPYYHLKRPVHASCMLTSFQKVPKNSRTPSKLYVTFELNNGNQVLDQCRKSGFIVEFIVLHVKRKGQQIPNVTILEEISRRLEKLGLNLFYVNLLYQKSLRQ